MNHPEEILIKIAFPAGGSAGTQTAVSTEGLTPAPPSMGQADQAAVLNGSNGSSPLPPGNEGDQSETLSLIQI